MQEKDNATNNYWSDNERFADIINVTIFQARNVLTKECLEKAESEIRVGIEKKGKKENIRGWKDVVKKAVFNTNFAIIGIENQSEIHYAMPVKIMGYDFSEYKKQLKEIEKAHREKGDLRGAEFLSGFSKEDRLKAMVTLVLYYGEEPWTGPKCLKDILDMQDIPEELKEMVNDYPIHIVDVRRFEDSEKLQTDARIVFGLLQRAKNGDAMEAYANENREEMQELSEDACDLLAAITGSKDFLKVKKENRNEKGSVDMCDAFRQLEEKYEKRGLEAGLAEGRARGHAEGREEGRAEGHVTGIKNLIETCKEFGNQREKVLLKLEEKYDLSAEEAEEYMKMYWK